MQPRKNALRTPLETRRRPFIPEPRTGLRSKRRRRDGRRRGVHSSIDLRYPHSAIPGSQTYNWIEARKPQACPLKNSPLK